ncbi:cytochrome ubiquinol oxidase subunit I [Erwinia sp. P7711]|uniref:cytochrome ubiquinol oxidase subunit I n=1 Tax=Erwinia sp. P7711 TaxID=3141451 RepID=UPI003189AAE0
MSDVALSLLLSRWQFAVTIGLHIILASFALGLASFLAFLEAVWLIRKEKRYFEAYTFWLKVFALTIVVGAVTGVLMEFQFGANWGPLSAKAGAVVGPLMFYEVLVAFFMESALAGVMIFGLNKIGPKLHFCVTLLVAIGAFISAFWILAANSWMQTPTGFSIDAAGHFRPDNWWSIIRSPSLPWRLTHMVIAALLATAFMVGGVGAWRLLRGLNIPAAKLMVSSSMWLAVVLMPVQIVVGDLHGENTLKYQPQKVAAMEGGWQSPPPGVGEPLRLFALPDQQEQRNHAEVAIPQIASLYLKHDLSSHIKSLSEFPPSDIPPVIPVFFGFRLMVGMGIMMLTLSGTALYLRLRRRLYESKALLKWMTLMAPAGFIAMLAGWVVTETGRQPWTVWGHLRTEESVSAHPANWIIASGVAILVVYAIAFFAGLYYFLRYVSTHGSEQQVKTHV